MPKLKQIPIALTIAGSDSGGGAGIQADLKTFAALGVHGTSVITCVTAQTPGGVRGIEACSSKIVQEQLTAVLEELRPVAIKTGMLFSRAIVRTVVQVLCEHRKLPLIVDPVMVSTSGTRLLNPAARKTLCDELLPRAALVTPNLYEAAILASHRVRDFEDLRIAARKIHHQFGCAALVKGGHLRGASEAVDIFYDGKQEVLLAAPFIRGVKTHGTGCTYSAAIAAYLGHGWALVESVRKAKTFISRAIARSAKVRGYEVLGWF